MRLLFNFFLKYILPLLVLAALTTWVVKRWNVWFGNPQEEPYTAQSCPDRVLLTFGDERENSRNVSWQCDSVVRNSYVELICLADSDTIRIEAQGEMFQSRCGRAVYYVARLRNLRPDCQYTYRAVTDTMCSPWYSFQTYPIGRHRFSFLYVGDVQDTLMGQANRFLREALVRHPKTEFLVCGGDLTERPAEQHWAETFRDVDSVAQAMPLLVVTGNHDYLKGLIRRLERRFTLVFSYFLDSEVGRNQVYSMRYGSAEFFLLDSNRELPYLLTQRRWLEKRLRESQAHWKILVLHHPLYSLKGKNNLVQRWVFDGLIRKYGVDLVLQGHEHAYARMTNIDSKLILKTTPVYTVSHCSPKNYRIQFDKRFDKFGISSRYYQTVEVKEDTLVLAAYEVYGHQLYDSLLIVKHRVGEKALVKDLGQDIPEHLEYTPNPQKKKDLKFARRIKAYQKRRHLHTNVP